MSPSNHEEQEHIELIDASKKDTDVLEDSEETIEAEVELETEEGEN